MNITTEQLFTEAHTQYGYQPIALPEATLRALYDLVKRGPTSANCQPARWVFVQSDAEKAKLLGCVSAGNQQKIREAPVTVLVGMDMAFYEHLPRLTPQVDARSWFAGKPAAIEEAAFRNSSLQGGYMILAARALGLDCGPMSGFDPAKMDAAFWSGTQVKTNFICTLGKGDPGKERPRNPRFGFDEVCHIV